MPGAARTGQGAGLEDEAGKGWESPSQGKGGCHGWAEQECSDQPAPHIQLLPRTALLGKGIRPSSLSPALPGGLD